MTRSEHDANLALQPQVDRQEVFRFMAIGCDLITIAQHYRIRVEELRQILNNVEY